MKIVKDIVYNLVLTIALLFTFILLIRTIGGRFHDSLNNLIPISIFDVNLIAYPLFFFVSCIPIGICDNLFNPSKKFRTYGLISNIAFFAIFFFYFLFLSQLELNYAFAATSAIIILSVIYMLYKGQGDSWLPKYMGL